MSENEFWEALRLRINTSSEFANLGYCDWFEPERYFLGPPEPRIEGRVGFVGGCVPGEYEFSVALPDDCENLSDLDWRLLVPTTDATRWASVEDGTLFMNLVNR